MAFLTASDYKPLIKDTILNQILDNDSTLQVTAESLAEAQIRSRLAIRYDVNAIFLASGSARNAEIVMIYADMVIYHLHSRITPGQVPKVRDDRYQDALAWLEKVAEGSYKPALPLIADSDGDGVSDGNVVQFGGSTPRNPYY